MDNYSKLKIPATLFLLFIISIPTALAIGVSSPYWKENPLKMYPGQIKEVSFALVNSPDEKENQKAYASLIEGDNIAKIISGTEYLISPASTAKKILLKISIPEDAQIGQSYNPALLIKSLKAEETGIIQLNIEYKVSFPILVVGSPEEASTEIEAKSTEKTKYKITLLIPAMIIAIIIVLTVYLSRKKKEKAS